MKRTKKPERPEWDDGRTVANMNVEGMPWYSPGQAAPGHPAGLREDTEGTAKNPAAGQPLTQTESRYYTWGALKAALAVIAFMCGGLVLFILFCQFVWFR